MKTTKTNIAFIIGIILLSALIIWAYFYMSSRKATPALVSCPIGDRYDIMTGKPCPPVYEEEEPAASTTVDLDNG